MTMNKTFSICYNQNIPNTKNIADIIAKYLKEKGLKVIISDLNNLSKICDFAFVVGGDGTILKAGRFYSKFNIPIFGINLGHLGFLSQASENELQSAIEKILNNDYRTEKRMMLECGKYCALNDFVIKSQSQIRTSSISIEINSEFVCDYTADGVIISTPTGSTAYAMSAGGPILTPDLEVLVITPICPHMLSVRPIVVNKNSIIRVYSKNKDEFMVCADGQETFLMADITIKKSVNYASLALLKDNSFYSVLRNKLYWGINPQCKF